MRIDWIFWLFMNFKLDFVHTIDIILFLLGIRWSLFRFLQRHSFSFYFLWPNQGHTKRATRVTNWICIPSGCANSFYSVFERACEFRRGLFRWERTSRRLNFEEESLMRHVWRYWTMRFSWQATLQGYSDCV